MIYERDKSGVSLVENDMSISDDFKIGYRVGSAYKESTIDIKDLPKELIQEFAQATNKIARYLEQGDDVEEYSFYTGEGELITRAEGSA